MEEGIAENIIIGYNIIVGSDFNARTGNKRGWIENELEEDIS